MSRYAEALKKQATIVQEKEKDVLLLSYHEGNVKYELIKSKEYEERQQKEAEKKKFRNSLVVQMQKAVEEIDARQAYYRLKDMNEYGYDHYTQEFYYKFPESDSEEET